jgi:hypothetical protein
MSTPSEQNSELELGREPARDVPRSWRRVDESDVDDEPGEQLTAPDADGMLDDREPTEVAEDAGLAYPAGPEAQAVHIVDEP